MHQLSITQRYFILAIGDTGKKTLSDSSEKGMGLIISSVLDLITDGSISLDDKGKLISNKPQFPAEQQYLASLYQLVEEKSPLKAGKLVNNYMLGFKNRITSVFQQVGDSLEIKGIVTKVTKNQVVGSVEFYEVEAVALANLAKELKVLVEKEWTIEESALFTVLDKGKILKQYLSRDELKKAKTRIKRFQKQPEGQMIKKIMNDFEGLLVASLSVFTG